MPDISIYKREKLKKSLKPQEKRSLKKKAIFLKVLAETGQFKKAQEAAGYTDNTYILRCVREDPKFKALYEEAWEKAMNDLESEAVRRAVEGVNEPVYYRGDVVGYKKVYSDQLLMFLLKGNKSDKYGQKINVEGEIQHNVGIALLPAANKDIVGWEQQAVQMHKEQQPITIEKVEDITE